MKDSRPPIRWAALWALCVALSAVGCAVQPVQPQSVPESIAAAERHLIAAAHTLADLADAGVISRDSSGYQEMAAAVREARDLIELAWRAHFAGDADAAGQWRDQSLQLYAALRPRLQDLQRRVDP